MNKLLSVVVFFCVAGGLAWFAFVGWLSHPAADAQRVSVTLPEHATARTVAETLTRQRIISSRIGYLLYAMFDSATDHPRPGTYSIKPRLSARALARQFAIGPAREEIEIKIIEGWSLDDETKALKAYGVDPIVFFKVSKVDSWKSEYTFLKPLPNDTTLEGYLFPNTYRVWKDQLPQSLIRKQLEAFSHRVASFLEDTQRQGRTLHEVVILASLIEKEVAKPEDRKLVAGIFWNRLRDRMPLQSDATINYLTHAGRTRPTYRDLEVNSPYNTYRHLGLPPGPISNPGADALEAALHPPRTSYRFFLTDATGKTYFAKTFEEHIRNRWKAFGK